MHGWPELGTHTPQKRCWFKPLTNGEVSLTTLRSVSERKFTGPVFFEETNTDPYANLILTVLVNGSGNTDRTSSHFLCKN